MVTREERDAVLSTLAEMARDYHKAFCVVQPGVPKKPQGEKDICLGQIYGYAKTKGLEGEAVDQIMDQAEKSYAQYAEA